MEWDVSLVECEGARFRQATVHLHMVEAEGQWEDWRGEVKSWWLCFMFNSLDLEQVRERGLERVTSFKGQWWEGAEKGCVQDVVCVPKYSCETSLTWNFLLCWFSTLQYRYIFV